MPERSAPALKIADLERLSGLGRSTIHFYRNLGLLPPPVRRGPKLHLYGREHVERLREIQRLRGDGHSIEALRRRFAERDAARGRCKEPATPRGRAPREPVRDATGDDLRDRILDVAARAFVERGFESVRVEDVAREVGVGKAKLYKLFSSKTDLFVDCLDRLRHAVFGSEQRATLDLELSFEDEGRLRSAAVLYRHEPYRMMHNLLAQAASSPDEHLAKRARAALHRLVTGAEPMFRRAMQAGRCRQANAELLAYMTWGALLAVGDRLALDDRYTIDEALEAYLAFVQSGTAPE